MEFSPLKYLDSDVSEILCDKVRLSQEHLSREYHIELYNEYKSNKKVSQSYFGFYSYLIVFLFAVTSMIGLLNLTREIIIYNFPLAGVYIEYLFENLSNFGILFRDTFNLY